MRRTLLALPLLVLASGCQTLRDPLDPRSLANAPCDARFVAALLASEEPLTRQEVAYLQRCGVRFASAE